MGCRGQRQGNENFYNTDMNRNNRCGVGSSLTNLIFSIISLSITFAFKTIEVIFKILFGMISAVGLGSRSTKPGKNTHEKTRNEKQAEYVKAREKASTNVNKIKKEEEFRKAENSKTETDNTQADNKDRNANKGSNEEMQNKDFYVVLFVMIIIPVIVFLAMGKPLYAGLVGAAGVVLMIAAGVVSGITARIRKKPVEQKVEEEIEEKDSVEKLIKDAFEKLFEIRKSIDRIEDAEVKSKIDSICCTGEKIIGEVRVNPESLVHVRKFFYYYIDAFAEIVKKYLKLSNFEESSEEVSKLISETEKSFSDIDEIFKELCEKLLEKDMMNLKAEINVIKNSN
jgi:5-bromo-4-chloroindolyl phosphate hydrolysis protein